MIRYNLVCDHEHEFESWFRDSAAFDHQAKKKRLECPVCGDKKVRKALMAPHLSKGGGKAAVKNSAGAAARDQLAQALGAIRAHVETNYDYVGDKFADEARRIHYGQTKKREIYGEATGDEAKDLVDEGVDVVPLPGPAKSEVN